MSFTQPHTYIDGAVLDADTHTSNEEACKVFVSQELTVGDIIIRSLETVDISEGSYKPITADYCLITGCLYSNHIFHTDLTRAYATSTAKNNNQKGVQWQSISGAGKAIVLSHPAEVLISFAVNMWAEATAVVANNGGLGEGKWVNEIRIQTESSSGLIIQNAGTRNYVFGPEGTTDTLDPHAELQMAQQRYINVSLLIQLPAGIHYLQAVIDPRSEQVYARARNFVVEPFYL